MYEASSKHNVWSQLKHCQFPSFKIDHEIVQEVYYIIIMTLELNISSIQ